MEARSPVPFCVAVVLGVAACAGSDEPAPDPPAGAGGSAIARDYLGGPPPQKPAARADGPRELNPAERWIAEHLPWVAPLVGH